MKRWLYTATGMLALGLGGLGVVLPGLPTTPFILLAAACFARSSPRLHAWLLASPLFGPLIQHWQQHRSIPRRAKILGLASLIVIGSLSILSLEQTHTRLAMGLLLLIPLIILLRLPSHRTA